MNQEPEIEEQLKSVGIIRLTDEEQREDKIINALAIVIFSSIAAVIIWGVYMWVTL